MYRGRNEGVKGWPQGEGPDSGQLESNHIQSPKIITGAPGPQSSSLERQRWGGFVGFLNATPEPPFSHNARAPPDLHRVRDREG